MSSDGQQGLLTVQKRDGRLQGFSRDKLYLSLNALTWGLNEAALDLNALIDQIVRGLPTQLGAAELRLMTAATAANLATKHPDFSLLAGRIYVTALHKYTDKSFMNWVMTYTSDGDVVLCSELADLVKYHGSQLDDAIVHARDFSFSYASIRTLAHSYLLRSKGRLIERPQHLYMRTALAIHKKNLDLVIRTYDALSRHLFTFATPTLANAGTLSPNYASCFLYMPNVENAEEMLRSAHDLDRLWLADGGIGISLGAVPCRRPRPCIQPGVLALMKVYDSHADYTSLWRETRPSAATVYLPIWHGDVRPFILCRTQRAARHEQVRNLFNALWIPDIFMERVSAGGRWTLFDPRDVPALLVTHGEAFTLQYEEYERSVEPVATILARDLWAIMSRAQEETGAPFILYQDAINKKSNESHIGVIQTSNLCTEIVQHASRQKTAVCTLASIAAPRFVDSSGNFDFNGFHDVTKLAVVGLNAILDTADYPTDEARLSAAKTRGLGVGVQGMADVFKAARVPFCSSLARDLNIGIYESLYHASYEASCELAESKGFYADYLGSPASNGLLQHDLWHGEAETGRYDFVELRERIRTFGLRNSVLTAQMPTASTAKLLGNFDGTDPYTSNVLVHRVLSGDYTEMCRWLVRDLEREGLWNEETRLAILNNHGSIQNIANIPAELKDIYRTAWEIDPIKIVDLAADRAPFIDQSQSLSLHILKPSPDEMLRIQLHGWRRGLKTGLYYMRTQAPAFPLPYGVSTMRTAARPSTSSSKDQHTCSPPSDGGPACESCSG